MSNKYSKKSEKLLSECDVRLQILFHEVLEIFDHSIITGHRTKEEQNKKFFAKPQTSKVRYPNSKHNSIPSMAVDAIPYPLDWNDRERLTLFAGVVLGVAAMKGISIRWGGDWDRDTEVKDNTFDDLVHFEIVGE